MNGNSTKSTEDINIDEGIEDDTKETVLKSNHVNGSGINDEGVGDVEIEKD